MYSMYGSRVSSINQFHNCFVIQVYCLSQLSTCTRDSVSFLLVECSTASSCMYMQFELCIVVYLTVLSRQRFLKHHAQGIEVSPLNKNVVFLPASLVKCTCTKLPSHI